MRIRKVLDKKVGDSKYYKYLITIPKGIVEESKFLDKDLSIILQDGKIILHKS